MEIAVKFPSPTGSSYFSMLCGVTRTLSMSSFPSPTGSSYFSMIRLVNIFNNDRMTVSVPYGVFVFLNLLRAQGHDLRSCGFRPLRGLRISQSHSRRLHRQYPTLVSVPCGVFVFLNGHRCLTNVDLMLVSVPCGVFVFLNNTEIIASEIKGQFPSPAGSSYFSIANHF